MSTTFGRQTGAQSPLTGTDLSHHPAKIGGARAYPLGCEPVCYSCQVRVQSPLAGAALSYHPTQGGAGFRPLLPEGERPRLGPDVLL
jgi:hypothetical protein